MDRKVQKINSPDYRRIYHDIIVRKYPDKKERCLYILEKDTLSALDIIRLNAMIFDNVSKETLAFNQRHRSYKPSAIQEILKYQEKNSLNNSQVAIHFQLSRNTIAKWKRLYSAN